MKNYIITLLMAVLCLCGCSSESDPQSVAFSMDEYEFDANGGTLDVKITANCIWYIVGSFNRIVNLQNGEGDTTLRVTIPQNTSYDGITYTIPINSEDGTSSDVLVIRQKAGIGMEIGEVGMIPAEGGSFTIPVRTNDESVQVETPEWITFTSSRALTGYTYSFTAEPNKTGAVRGGTVTLKGSTLSKSVEVEQDSYAPTGVELREYPNYISSKEFATEISLIPEYADYSKLGIKRSANCIALIENDTLSLSLTDYGKFTVYFLSDDKEIERVDGEYIPSSIFSLEETQEVYLGQSDFLSYWYYTSDYILKSSDESVVEIDEHGKPYAVGFGSSVISVTHPEVDVYDEVEVKVEPFLIESGIGWLGETGNGTFDVNFAARLEGPYGMTCSGFLISDKDGYVEILNEGNISYSSLGETASIVKIWSNTINVSRAGYSNILDALEGYRLMAEVVIDGKVYQRTVRISMSQVSY